MHFGYNEGLVLTDGICGTDVNRAARRLQRPAAGRRERVPAGIREGVPAGIREGVPAGIPEAFCGHPQQA